MYLNMKHMQLLSRSHSKGPAKQQGGLLPVAIFVIVVMSILGIAMVRLLADASRSTVADVYGARADLAARSGAEIMLMEIFPLNAPPNNGACVERGTTLVEQTVTFATEGLNSCSTTIACDYLELNAPYGGTNYRVFSQGNCEVGNNSYSKQLILEASHEVQ